MQNKQGKILYKELFITAFILVSLSIFFFRKTISEFPSHIHAWTQSDRYALALGYVDNGLDLFHPSTYNLQPAYKAAEVLSAEKGITRVDMPLPDYLAAFVMSVAGTRSPVVFRLIVLLIGLTGLLFFFAFSRKLGNSFLSALFLTLFVFSVPVFTYYLDGFIPSIPAFSLSVAAIYYYHKYLNDNNYRDYLLASGLLLLASLIRMPFIMPLLIIFMIQFFKNLKDKPILLKESLTALFVLAIFGMSLTYNQFLGRVYGSLFLNELMPAHSLAELKNLFFESLSNWKWQYFSWFQYIILIPALFGLVFSALKKTIPPAHKILAFFGISGLILAMVYFAAMAQQFPAHDYYWIDVFLLPLVLITTIGWQKTEALCINRILKSSFYAFMGIALVLMLMSSYNIQNERNTPKGYDRTEITKVNFTDGESLCKEAGIAKNERVLVIDAYTYNSPLILLNRKGYTVLNTSKEDIEEALRYNFDFIAIQNRFLASDVLRNAPELRSNLEPIANNGKIGLYRYGNQNEALSYAELLGTKNQSFLFSWQNSNPDGLVQSPENTYFKLIDTVLTLPQNSSMLMTFESEAILKAEAPVKLQFVMDLSDPTDKQLFAYYDSFELNPFFEKHSQQAKIEVTLNIPKPGPNNTRVKVYIWNQGRNDLVYKNLKLDIIQYIQHTF
jgi:hypothetical protein